MAQTKDKTDGRPHILDKVNFRCRNNNVLIQMTNVGETDTGIALPDIAVQGKKFHVVGKGPKVEDLQIGDEVLMTGLKNTTYFELPFAHDLIMTLEEYVVLVITEKK